MTRSVELPERQGTGAAGRGRLAQGPGGFCSFPLLRKSDWCFGPPLFSRKGYRFLFRHLARLFSQSSARRQEQTPLKARRNAAGSVTHLPSGGSPGQGRLAPMLFKLRERRATSGWTIPGGGENATRCIHYERHRQPPFLAGRATSTLVVDMTATFTFGVASSLHPVRDGEISRL